MATHGHNVYIQYGRELYREPSLYKGCMRSPFIGGWHFT